MTMFEEDGRPFFADPRQVLAAVVARYRDHGWTPVVAAELEFYLTDPERAADGRPMAPTPPGRHSRENEVQVYDMTLIADYNAFIDQIYRCCAIQGLPVEATITEYAPGQMEVNLTHVANACRAADQTVLLKRLIKGVAQAHGYAATFMAKPFADQAGNGMHVHFSVVDDGGRNIFDDGGEGGTETLHHAIGGLAATMGEGMLLWASNVNSYRRFQPGSYAPTAPTWGYDNRTVALRVPAGPPPARRIEHRVAGADTNPYGLIAGILAGALHGIEARIDPGPPVEGNAYATAAPSLPDNCHQGIRAFAESTVFADLLGADFCRVYAACKREEYERFNTQVTRREIDWYFDSV
jgi:glutamine synthetase